MLIWTAVESGSAIYMYYTSRYAEANENVSELIGLDKMLGCSEELIWVVNDPF